MLSATRNQSSLDLHSFEDPSLSSHLNTIQTEVKNLPRLKYSLACISNILAYNNSNRLYNIASISKPNNFRLIVNLLINYQDQKILEESLFILNVLLNEGNDLTVKQENDIMHSLSYVKVNTQQEKGFISDKLAQEILMFSYKVKTKHELSQFIATLLSQKMSGAQAKKFIKELKKEELKNISISNLIKIGIKFKTNVVLMNQILTLIYEKVFAGKDQHQIKDLFEFLPKIVEQNIDEESISYKCLQIFKTIQSLNNKNKLDPLISRYLESLLKYKKELFLPLKRQYVSTADDLINILEFGKEFEIYHMLVLDYLVRNGFTGGKQSWKESLEGNNTKKNLKIKQICLRLASDDRDSSKTSKIHISQSEQMELIQTLPIEGLMYASTILQKLLSQPSISNSLYVIKKLCYYKNSHELLLTIHRISLKQKEFHLVEQIEKLVKESYTEQFVYDQMKNITKVKHKIVLKGQLYFIWLPILLKNDKLLNNLQNQLVEIMGYESVQIEDKFYVIEYLLEHKLEKPVNKFLLYLNRQLESLSSIQEETRNQGNILFVQIKHYLRKWTVKIKENPELINFYSGKLLANLQRTSELLFSKLVEFKSQEITAVLFELQKWDFYGQNWKQPYRWILTALQQISEQTPLYTLDCLELFEMSIQNIPQNLIPSNAKDRFIKSVYKNWPKFQSQHLFAIERIVQMLWQNHQYPILKKLTQIIPVSELIQHQVNFNKKNEYFFESEHPTSNWLINLQMSHFFGVISQEEFVKYILQLYDRKYSDVKRFTEKNVISLMNFIIWIYQYSEQDMEKGLSDMILAFLGYKAQGANEISSYNIRKKCIEIVAVVSHSINLLKLPIKQLLQAYIGQAGVLQNLNQIIQTIIDSKPSFIAQLNLQTIIQSVMLSLITLEDLPLIEQYINLIEAICYIEDSQYPQLLQNSIETLYQILKVQFKIVQKYRKNMVSFILDLLQHYQFQPENQLLWFLMNKYFVQENIQITILQTILSNNQDQPFKLNYSNEKLLVRLIMHHNENHQIIQMVQKILTTSEKQTSINIIQSTFSEGQKDQNKPNKKDQKKQEIKMSAEDDFMVNFTKKNYRRCQELLGEIRNPFMKIKRQEIKDFLGLRELNQYENLLIFIANNPTTRNELMSIEQFYLREECLTFIYKMADNMTWGSQSLQRIKIKEFDSEALTLKTELNSTDSLIKNTVTSLFSTQNVSKNIIYLLKSIKATKHQIQLLGFYSKCIPQSNKNIMYNIIKETKMEEGIEFMKLNLDYKISNPSQASCEMLLFHLFVRLQNLNFVKPQNLQSEQRYIKEIVPLIYPAEMMKSIVVANEFFISLSTKIQHKINSKIIFRQLTELCYRYMVIFEACQGVSGSKNIQLKLYESTALISTLLFLLKNNDNVYVGLPGKTLSLLEPKIQLYPILKGPYDFIINKKDKYSQQTQKANPKQTSNQQNPSQSSTLTNAIKTKNQSQTNKKPQASVVYAKEMNNEEEPQKERQNDVSEAFRKGKELEPYMSIVSRQPKPNIEQFQNIKSSNKTSNQSIELSIQQADQQSLIRPKETGFDTKKFYELQSPVSPQRNVSEKERKQLVNIIKSKQNEQISIATLKEHSKFIYSLLDHKVATNDQIEELMKSIESITSTVNEHHYYVKKLVELEVSFKLINLFKRKDTFIPPDKQSFKAIFESKLLKLHHAMSYKKQKKTIIFDDELTIQFFKFILQKSLSNKQPRPQNSIIIEIVTYCIKSIDAFFKQGLISMFIELLKTGLNTQDVLNFFCKIELNKHIIFEIYQRGLLDKFAEVFSSSQEIAQITILNLWIKLAGKICTTSAIQDKYVQKNIHQLVWGKYLQHLSNDLESKKNLAFLFAYLGKRNNKVFEFLVQNQVLQKLFSSLQKENCQQLYLLFYNTLVQNQNALEYSFRIKYHFHLIEKVNKPPEKPKSKFFYKSLGQIMSSKQHQSLFFKEQIISALVKEYNLKPEPSIYECLLDFILSLENDKEFEELKKQNFWSCLSLFQYKLSSQATYAYILQIFLVMIKKGRIKQFNTAEVRGKVTLKAEYSINLEGKQLALRFVTALSLRTKECYITERCIRLLSSLVGFKVTSNELDIIEDILDVEGMLQNYQFFSFCHDYEITHAICNRFKNFDDNELLSALKILNILGTQSKNNKVLRDKLLIPVMEMLKAKRQKPLDSLIEEWLFKVILITASYRQNSEIVQKLELGTFMAEILQTILMKEPKDRTKTLNEYLAIIEMCNQNAMIPLIELQKIIEKLNKAKLEKEFSKISQIKVSLQGMVASESNQILTKMTQGVKGNMYKSDGSSSQLMLYITGDKLELNCSESKGGPVKQKWRIVLSEITDILGYSEEKEYQMSAFYRAGGLFTKAPDRKLCLTVKSRSNQLNVAFQKKEDKDSWKKYIEFAIENSKKILKQFK